VLPRLVEQTRALLYIQAYLTVFAVLAAIVWGAALSSRPWPDASDKQLVDRLLMASLILAVTAALLALACTSFRRGWRIGWPLALIGEVAALLVSVVLTSYLVLTEGTLVQNVVLGAVIAVYAISNLWIPVNLFRPQVLRFFLMNRAGSM
jgi:hypothetical protein